VFIISLRLPCVKVISVAPDAVDSPEQNALSIAGRKFVYKKDKSLFKILDGWNYQ